MNGAGEREIIIMVRIGNLIHERTEKEKIGERKEEEDEIVRNKMN